MWEWLFGNSKSSVTPAPIEIPGGGFFDFEIVGESFYQTSLGRIAGPKNVEAKRKYVRARLVCEENNPHDANAVAVLIHETKVGHLSRDDAVDWRASLRRNFGELPDAFVDAVIVGGWRDEHSEGHYGVKLDL